MRNTQHANYSATGLYPMRTVQLVDVTTSYTVHMLQYTAACSANISGLTHNHKAHIYIVGLFL